MEGHDKWAYSKLSLQSATDVRIVRSASQAKSKSKFFSRLKAELEAKARPKRYSLGSGQPPIDSHSKVFLAFVLSGIGYMLPFTCFISAVDYYQNRFPHSTIIFDMTTTTIVVGTLGVILNNLLVEILSLTWRVMVGFVVSTLVLLFLTIFDITMNMFSLDTGYWVTLVAVAVISVGCTVQQSSFYGYANMLPRRYTQAVMLGESVAGVLVSANRIATKLLLKDERVNTIIFFVISLIIIAVCCLAFFFARWTRFVRHHLRSCRADGKAGECYDTDFKMHQGSVQLQFKDHEPEIANTDVQQPTSGDINTEMTNNRISSGLEMNTSEKLSEEIDVKKMLPAKERDSTIDHIGSAGDMGSSTSLVHDGPSAWKARLDARVDVVRQIYPFMASFALTFFVSVSLYPGIISEVVSCRLGTWMPVVLMACFNVTDALGKVNASLYMLTAVIHSYSKIRLFLCTLSRLGFIPLVILCIMPRFHPILNGEVWSIFITMLLGLSNGYFGCLPLVLAPSQVTPYLRELCGNTMMLSFTLAIMAGTFASYGLDILVGSHPDLELCHTKNKTVSYFTGEWETNNSSLIGT